MEPVLPFELLLPTPRPHGLAKALHRRLRAAIVDQCLPPAYALPSTRRLADALGVGRNTVIAAYDTLVAEGLARARPGARLRVVGGPAPQRVAAGPAAAPVLRSAETRLAPTWRLPMQPAAAPLPASPAPSFRTGTPEHRHFDHATWRRLMAGALRAAARAPFAYGPADGLPALREAIAGHVAFARAVSCGPDDVVVTAGAQQAFDLLARVLVEPGRTRVAVEDPGYPPARAAFAAAGAQLVPVPVDEQGLRVDRLPEGVRVICVTPSHQSPTGAVMSAPRRALLLERARALGAVVIEDDYDGEFMFGRHPQDALQTLDREGRVLYVGTFSKCLFPSLRQGFVVAPAWAREALIDARRAADGHGDATTQAALARFITEGHLARHIRRLRPVYAQRRQALAAALQAQVGDWLAVLPGEAGLSLSAQVHRSADMPIVLAAAARHLPGALPLAACALGRPQRHGLVIGYGTVEVDDIVRAVRALGRSLGRAPRRRG